MRGGNHLLGVTWMVILWGSKHKTLYGMMQRVTPGTGVWVNLLLVTSLQCPGSQIWACIWSQATDAIFDTRRSDSIIKYWAKHLDSFDLMLLGNVLKKKVFKQSGYKGVWCIKRASVTALNLSIMMGVGCISAQNILLSGRMTQTRSKKCAPEWWLFLCSV